MENPRPVPPHIERIAQDNQSFDTGNTEQSGSPVKRYFEDMYAPLNILTSSYLARMKSAAETVAEFRQNAAQQERQ